MDSPRQREAYAWVTAELANLRAAFRWAADCSDLTPGMEEVDEVELVVQRVAALDLGKATLEACMRVPHPSKPGRRMQEIRGRPTRTFSETMTETPPSRPPHSFSGRGGVWVKKMPRKVMRLSNVPKRVPIGHENGPRSVLRGPFYLVAGTGFEPATSGL